MELRSLTPMLRTWNLSASVTFYTEVLGFECETLSEEWGWAYRFSSFSAAISSVKLRIRIFG